MNQWTFPTKIFAGHDSLLRLKQFRQERILVVCDPFLEGTENLNYILNELRPQNEVSIYTDVVPDPPISHVVKGVEFIQKLQPTVVIAIGGGSAIDLTKAVLYFARHMGYSGVRYFTVIPTTSGTGSEVTSFAVITDPTSQIKYPILDESLLPQEAILTPLFVKTAPPKVTAYSGMDVLVHAIEAIVSTGANNFTDALAEKALELVFEYLPKCFAPGATEEDRMGMHEASCMAGLAFNRAGLGITHALAHQLGGQFHIPHGLANAMLIARVVMFNAFHSETAYEKYVQLAKKLGFADNGTDKRDALVALVKAILQLARTVECPLNISAAANVSAQEARQKVSIMADKALQDMTYQTNPYAASKDDLENLLLMIM